MAKGNSSLEKSEAHRKAIRDSNIVGRLIRHAAGRGKMSATQVRAADILLKKVLPDLQAIEMRAEIEQNVIHHMPRNGTDWLSRHGHTGVTVDSTAECPQLGTSCSLDSSTPGLPHVETSKT